MLTHKQACSELRGLAKSYSEGYISRAVWFTRVDAILSARFPGGLALRRAPGGA